MNVVLAVKKLIINLITVFAEEWFSHAITFFTPGP